MKVLKVSLRNLNHGFIEDLGQIASIYASFLLVISWSPAPNCKLALISWISTKNKLGVCTGSKNKGESSMPRRDDVYPVDVPNVLPGVTIVDE